MMLNGVSFTEGSITAAESVEQEQTARTCMCRMVLPYTLPQNNCMVASNRIRVVPLLQNPVIMLVLDRKLSEKRGFIHRFKYRSSQIRNSFLSVCTMVSNLNTFYVENPIVLLNGKTDYCLQIILSCSSLQPLQTGIRISRKQVFLHLWFSSKNHRNRTFSW